MYKLTEISKDWKIKADKLLKEKSLIEDLSKFGKVYFTGSYLYNLMTHGDIDIMIVRDKKFEKEEIFEIFKSLYFHNEFRSYFIGGDWDNPKIGKEFPNGHYLGFKEKINNEKWKFDIWFISELEFENRKNMNPSMENLDNKQIELILECKKHRDENHLNISSQGIYNLVLDNKIKNLDDFKNNL